jgi:hypothetical protein
MAQVYLAVYDHDVCSRDAGRELKSKIKKSQYARDDAAAELTQCTNDEAHWQGENFET